MKFSFYISPKNHERQVHSGSSCALKIAVLGVLLNGQPKKGYIFVDIGGLMGQFA